MEINRLHLGRVRHLAALEPVDAALVLTTMRYAHEIRRHKDLDLPAAGKGLVRLGDEAGPPARRHALQRLGSGRVPDTYSDALRKVIRAKVEGKEPTAAELPEPARVTDLMEALRRSLEKRPRKLAKAPATRRNGRKAAVA